ncbi:fungal-specific transcription factor-like protein [Massarina eburnea CBS 473.64]|uniref:Fungal-specific transcription factor-like protein n=1 Tax=Massarina eburnea CBS 473.64 TaxID=1395130 RepID=A0A6A6RUM8_9PLEO|nr:fungal-specific transcription factor-like protein [Massarina eburnea CBS 473.64]
MASASASVDDSHENDENGNGNQKRKSEDGAPQPRAKRNRYISIACNECKRRKIKCNGQTPCQRCGNLQLECTYAPNCCNNFKESEEFKQMSAQISSLQEQVEQLFTNLTTLRHHVETQTVASNESPFGAPEYMRAMSGLPTPVMPPSPARHRTKSISKHPRFHGPTANAFSFGVAKSSLKNMGITGTEDGDDEGAITQDATPMDSPPLRHPMTPRTALHADKDPIWALTRHQAVRLVSFWHEETGMMYPLLDIKKISRHADMLFSFVEAASRAGLMQGGLPGADAIEDEQTTILKIVLATALTLEGNGKSPLGERLFNNVHKVLERTLSDPVDLRSIQTLAIAGMYHFHRDDEGLAWRTIGLAARQCLELGLHRGETYASFTDPEELATAIRTFWCVYVLDRRWSLGTGMPFALQDADIDQNLPKPDESTQYLNAMISYSLIGSKVWRSITNADAAQMPINNDDIQYLDFQVLNWHRSIPNTLKFVHPESGQPADQPSRAIHRLQIALYLRANQMRILIYRPVLHSATNIMEHLEFAHTVVTVSKDTIRMLTYLNQTSDIYKTQQILFNWFLISALAVLFLAVAHAPAEFNSTCRDEFYMALELVRGLSSNSYVSKRLWKTIKMLKEVGPRLGLNIRHEANDHDHQTAAVAMAGLAGHQVDELAMFSNGRSGQVDTPHGMAADLNTLFEAAGAFGSMMSVNGFEMGSAGENSGAPLGHGGDFVTAGAFGHENDELARIMRDLF